MGTNTVLTKEQKGVVVDLLAFLKRGEGQTISVGGYAGTGKTLLISKFRGVFGKIYPKAKVAMCAYTGKASRVMQQFMQQQKSLKKGDTVSTIHSLIYSPMTNKSGQVTGWKRKSSLKADLVIVDEASMVDELLWQDLLLFEVPIIAVGDHGQLPPVGSDSFLMKDPDLVLSKIHRQVENNPIIALSVQARTEGKINVGNFGDGVRKLDRHSPETGQEVEEILYRYSRDMLVLTGFNHTRRKLNQQIRMLMDMHGEQPRVGDSVICLKNNWDKQIYNGMLGKLTKIIPLVEDAAAVSGYEVEIVFDADDQMYDGKIFVEPFQGEFVLSELLKTNRTMDVFDYGYALTVHKAQGSQAESVLLFEERNQHMSDDDWRRWLYTGVTRAENYLTIVGFD